MMRNLAPGDLAKKAWDLCNQDRPGCSIMNMMHWKVIVFFGGGHIVLQRFVHVRCHFQPLPTKLVFAYFDRGSYVQMPHQILGNEKKPADWTPAINHADHSGRPSMAQSWFSRCSLVTAGGCGVCSNWSLITDHSEAPVLQTNKKISDGCDMWSSQGCIYVSATFRDIQSWSKQTRNMHAVKHAPMIFK